MSFEALLDDLNALQKARPPQFEPDADQKGGPSDGDADNKPAPIAIPNKRINASIHFPPIFLMLHFPNRLPCSQASYLRAYRGYKRPVHYRARP